jgi:hypothetical protein
MPRFQLATLALVFFLPTYAACSSSGSGSTASDGGAGGAAGSGGRSATGGTSGGNLSFDGGCLTYAGAVTVCGDGSAGTICAFSAQCGTSTSAGQCEINCSMGAGYSKCYGAADVACLQNAMTAQSCAALTRCGWIL